jgi:hypothetical protein
MRKRNSTMIQWIGALVAVLGLLYTGYKDYQHGDIKLPTIPQKELTKPKHPIQYCLMAYDPNLNKIFYLHENGQWHDFPPELRRYPETTQYNQNQNQSPVGNAYGTQGGSNGYVYGQQTQATAYPQRH